MTHTDRLRIDRQNELIAHYGSYDDVPVSEWNGAMGWVMRERYADYDKAARLDHAEFQKNLTAAATRGRKRG